MNFLICDRLQSYLIEFLRNAFTYNTEYTYTSDLDVTQIAIFRDFPKTLPPYPIVLVHTPSLDDLPRSFNNDLLKPLYGERVIDGLTLANALCFQVFGGTFMASCSLSVHAPTTKMRELIVDWIISYFRHVYKDLLEAAGLDILDIKRPGTSYEIYGSELLYLSEISFGLFGQWERIIDIDDNVVKQMDLSGSLILPSGTTTTGIHIIV